MTSICNVFMFYLIFKFLMLIFEFHVSSVISQTIEIYIEKIIDNSKKSKKKTFTHSLLMSNTNEST
jgi:hypothetical protein